MTPTTLVSIWHSRCCDPIFIGPDYSKTLSQFLTKCLICQATKLPPTKKGTLSSITVSEPFELVRWDNVCTFPTWAQGNKYILVITKYLTRWCKVIPHPNVTTNTLAPSSLGQINFPTRMSTTTSIRPSFPIQGRSHAHAQPKLGNQAVVHIPPSPTNKWLDQAHEQDDQAKYLPPM